MRNALKIIIPLLCLGGSLNACASTAVTAQLQPQPALQKTLDSLYQARLALQQAKSKSRHTTVAIQHIDKAIRQTRLALEKEWAKK